MPVLFLKEINPVKINQSNGTLAVQTYKTDITSYGKSISGKLVTTVLSVIRILLATVFLSIINIITAIKLKERLKRKMTYKNQSNLEIKNVLVELSKIIYFLLSKSFTSRRINI